MVHGAGRRWARDSLEEDWQDTAAFRTIICNWLDACLTAGTWEYTSGGDYGKELLDGLEGDKNLLYAVARRGSVLYTNTSGQRLPLLRPAAGGVPLRAAL